MVAIVGTLLFAITLATSCAVLASSLMPAWPRIVALLRYGVDIGAPMPPQPAMVSLRRSSLRAMPAPASPLEWREAA